MAAKGSHQALQGAAQSVRGLAVPVCVLIINRLWLTFFRPVREDELSGALLKMEAQLMVKGHKFGILYALAHQSSEEEFFQNCSAIRYLQIIADALRRARTRLRRVLGLPRRSH